MDTVQLAVMHQHLRSLGTWNPPCSLDEIVAMEHRHAVTLPDDYRRFLLDVGNGGSVGNEYILPLGMSLDDQELVPWPSWQVGALAKPFAPSGSSAFFDSEAHDDDDDEYEDGDDEDEDDEDYEDDDGLGDDHTPDGAFPIAYLGCTLWQYLVVTGAERGLLWELDAGAFSPTPSPLLRPITFSEWVLVEAAKAAKRSDLIDQLRGN